MPLNTLPNENLLSTISHLDTPELLQVRRMSRQFEHLVMQSLVRNRVRLKEMVSKLGVSLALTVDNQNQEQLYLWGDSAFGQEGLWGYPRINKRIPQPIPMTFLNGAKISKLFLGYQRILIHARTEDGQDKLFTWGNNAYGQLGLGHFNPVHIPTAIDMSFLQDAEITHLIPDGNYTLMRVKSSDGSQKLYTWGSNENGQLGLGDGDNRHTPEAIDMSFLEGADMTDIITKNGSTFIMAKKQEEPTQVFAWGYNQYGQLGFGDTLMTQSPNVVNMNHFNDYQVKKVYTNGYFSLMLAENAGGEEKLFSCGRNRQGELGLGHMRDASSPLALDMAFLNGAKVQEVVLGPRHSIIKAEADTGEEQLFVWGRNRQGVLGLGHSHAVLSPQLIDTSLLNGARIKRVYPEFNHTIVHAITENNEDKLLVFGNNYHGMLGLGHTDRLDTPQLIDMGFLQNNRIRTIYSNRYYCHIHTHSPSRLDGLMVWGSNMHGQLGVDSDERILEPSNVNLETMDEHSTISQAFEFGQYQRRLRQLQRELPQALPAIEEEPEEPQVLFAQQIARQNIPFDYPVAGQSVGEDERKEATIEKLRGG